MGILQILTNLVMKYWLKINNSLLSFWYYVWKIIINLTKYVKYMNMKLWNIKVICKKKKKIKKFGKYSFINILKNMLNCIECL